MAPGVEARLRDAAPLLSGKMGRRPGVCFVIWGGGGRQVQDITLQKRLHPCPFQDGRSGTGLPAQAPHPQLPTVAQGTISRVDLSAVLLSYPHCTWFSALLITLPVGVPAPLVSP